MREHNSVNIRTQEEEKREKINKLKKKRSTWSTCWAVRGTVQWERRWRVRQDDEIPGGGVGSAIDKDSEPRTFNIKFANSQPMG